MLSSNEIYQGDARELLPQVRPESVALSFWSPPYFVGKSYEADLDFADWSDLMRETMLLGCSEQTIDRRLKNNNVRGGKYAPQTRVKLTAGLIEQWAYDAGFYLYDRRVWVKDPTWENSRWHSLSYRAVDEFEHLLIFWKPGITVVNRNRLDAGEWAEWGSRSVWEIRSVRSNSAHESQFPIELPRRMIRLLTEPDDLVLDCFIGSGTTALAAIEQGRRFMGFDISRDSVSLAEKRVTEALATQRMLPL